MKADSKWEVLTVSIGKDGMCVWKRAWEVRMIFQWSCLAHSLLLRYSSNPTFIQQVDERGRAWTSQIQLWNQHLSLHWVYITKWNRCIWKWSGLTSASRWILRSPFTNESNSNHLYKCRTIVSSRVIVAVSECGCTMRLCSLLCLTGDPGSAM